MLYALSIWLPKCEFWEDSNSLEASLRIAVWEAIIFIEQNLFKPSRECKSAKVDNGILRNFGCDEPSSEGYVLLLSKSLAFFSL